jgi:hypothetical protein
MGPRQSKQFNNKTSYDPLDYHQLIVQEDFTKHPSGLSHQSSQENQPIITQLKPIETQTINMIFVLKING